MSELPLPIRKHFTAFAATHRYSGPLGELLDGLRTGTLSSAERYRILDEAGCLRDVDHRKAELDLILSFLQRATEIQDFDREKQQSFSLLKELFGVREEEFLQHRPVELATLLTSQLELILEDGIIDPREDEYQVALQAALDLGYDRYLALSRRAFERTALRLNDGLAHEQNPQLIAELRSKLAALEPLLRLAELQHRTLGALY